MTNVPTLADMLARTVTLDGVPGVPWAVAMAFSNDPDGSVYRHAMFGKVLACGPVEFPPPYGERIVTLCEGGGHAYYPEADPFQRVQKVNLLDEGELRRVKQALGVA